MDRLVAAHITAKKQLQRIASHVAVAAWDRLPGYDRENVDEFLSTALPPLHGANLQAVALTEAYLARKLGRLPLGVSADVIVAGIRNGAAPTIVYERAFVQVWSALGKQTPWEDAVQAGRSRVESAAATDVQLTFRDTLMEVGQADNTIMGFQRVADGGACDFCQEVDGAQFLTDDPMPLHNNCVAGDTRVALGPPDGASESTDLGRAHAVTRRRYVGQVVVLRTAAGHELTVTPNHPILTDRGWVAAGLLREGDDVVSGSGFDREHGRVPDEEDMPARIEDRFRAGAMAALVSVPFAAEQFHGDVGNGEVHVVAADGGLDAGVLGALLEPREEGALAGRLRLAASLPCDCGSRETLFDSGTPTHRRVRRFRPGGALLRRQGGVHQPALLRRTALLDAGFAEVTVDDRARDAVALRNRQDRLPASIGSYRVAEVDSPAANEPTLIQRADERTRADADGGGGLLRALARHIQPDRLVELRRIEWSGDVFNLVTRDGWYAANGVITHNCGCGVDPITVTGRSFKPTPTPDTVAIHDHGELGPVLTAPGEHFTTESQIAA